MGERLGFYMASVQAALGNPPSDMISQEEIIKTVNRSYFEVLRLFSHRRMKRDTTILTVSGTQEYALPSDYFWMRHVHDETNDETLIHKTLAFIKEEFGLTETGPGVNWTTEDQNILLGPIPDGGDTIRLWYMSRPAVLVEVIDTDILEAEWTEIIELGAIYRAFFVVGEYDRQIHSQNMQRSLINTITETQDLEKATGVDVAAPLTVGRSATH